MTDESHIAQITRQADSCLVNGDLTQARRLYAEICRARDNDAQAWLMYGAINGELGNVEVARSALERAVALEPANAEAHLALAHLLRSAQKHVAPSSLGRTCPRERTRARTALSMA